MGVLEVLGRSPVEVAKEYLARERECGHKPKFARRVKLYRDDSEQIICEVIDGLFDDQTIRSKLKKFAKVAKSQALFKRIVDEVCAPVYATPPVRTVSEAAQSFRRLEREVDLTGTMDMTLRLCDAANHSLIHTYYSPSMRKVRMRILTPDAITVVPHPDDPTEALALLYDKCVYVDGGEQIWHVYWDDRFTFQLNANNELIPLVLGGPLITEHGYRRMPFTWAHRSKRFGGFWDVTTGESRVAAQLTCAVLQVLSLRLLKAQGFKTIAIAADTARLPPGQVLDEESAIVLPEGAVLQSVDLKSDASHYIALSDFTKIDAAANAGLSRARMNQEDAQGSMEEGLLERRAEGIKLMRDVEEDAFDVLKMISQEHDDPERRMPESATVKLDFGEWSVRTDPQKELDIAQQKRNQGLRNFYQDMRRENPELTTDDECQAMIEDNVSINTQVLDILAARNQSQGATPTDPGNTPEQNGALGPMMRDALDVEGEVASVLRAVQ
jgi:hypothetical protein